MSRLDAAARAGIAEWDRVEPNNPVSASFVASHVDSIRAALAAAEAHDAANGVHRVTLDDPEVQAALFQVESIHQIHDIRCLCGFTSYVSRDRTKHIMDVTVAAAVKEGQ